MNEPFDLAALEERVARYMTQASLVQEPVGRILLDDATWVMLASMPANFRRATARLSDTHVAIARFAAIECEFQISGEASVGDMVAAWAYAQGRAENRSLPTEDDVLCIAAIVDPAKNLAGYRRVGVRVGNDIKMDWGDVPMAMVALVERAGDLDPAEWFRSFEEVHPFRDGNGRTGVILFNWLQGTLTSLEPEWPPNFWRDPRRREGRGVGKLAPRA